MRDRSELLSRISQGDTEALSELYDDLSGLLFAMCLRILGDRALAEQTLQNAFINIWQKAGVFDAGRASARTWIVSMTRNLAIDEWRRQRRELQTEQLDDLSLPDPSPGGDPLEQAIEGEMAGRVRSALASLPPDQSRALFLAYFTGFSHSQIARHLDTPVGTVKSRIQLGLDKLRRKLKPQYIR